MNKARHLPGFVLLTFGCSAKTDVRLVAKLRQQSADHLPFRHRLSSTSAFLHGVGRDPTQSGTWWVGETDVQERLNSQSCAAFRTGPVE